MMALFIFVELNVIQVKRVRVNVAWNLFFFTEIILCIVTKHKAHKFGIVSLKYKNQS